MSSSRSVMLARLCCLHAALLFLTSHVVRSAPVVSSFALPLTPPGQNYLIEDAFPDLNFDHPVAILAPALETNRLFVVEHPGRVIVITNLAAPTRSVFIDLTDRVHMQSESGLLGLAFHPQYATNGYFYVTYSSQTDSPLGFSPFNNLSRFEVDPMDPNRALPESELVMISQKDRSLLHNAGGLAFGPDGYLYVGLGDEADGSDPYRNSQRIDLDYFSGILRLDVDGRPGSLPPNPHLFSQGNYFIPPDNPFVGAVEFNGVYVNPDEIRTEFYAVGLRNPWRFAFDALTGDMYINDVGQLRREEVNIGLKGGNYGWVGFEGTLPHVTLASNFYTSSFALGPLADYGRAFGNAISAGLLYRGHAYPELEGAYVFADYGSGQIGTLRFADSALAAQLGALEQALEGAESDYESAVEDPDFLDAFDDWEANEPAGWKLLAPESMSATSGSQFIEMEDLSYLVEGPNPSADTYEIVAELPVTNLVGARLELVPDESLLYRGPGRAGNFVLSEFKVFVAEANAPGVWMPVALAAGRVSFHLEGFGIEKTWDGSHGTGWAIALQYYGKQHFASFEFAEPVELASGSRIRIQMLHTWGSRHNIGRFRLSVTDRVQDLDEPHPPFATYILSTPESRRTPSQTARLKAYYQSIAPSMDTLRNGVQDLRRSRQELLDGGPLPIEWIASDPGIVSFGLHPANGRILAADYTEGKIKVLSSQRDPSETPFPESLAETGVFQDLETLAPNPGVVSYEINTPFWSDHAIKSRWVLLFETNRQFHFEPENPWGLPTGSAWMKHFEMEMTRGDPASRKRLETRFLVRNDQGVYGVTYRWNHAQTNAYLVPPEGLDEVLTIVDGDELRTQTWRYPSRGECLQCHTSAGGLALGFNTGQLNRTVSTGDGATNQILKLAGLGYFSNPATDLETWPRWAEANDENASLERRMRSYLAANCAQCHQPGGLGRGFWDARYSTPLTHAGILEGMPVDDLGDPANRIVAPGDTNRSLLYRRVAELGEKHMPPLATSVLNESAIRLLQRWIVEETPYTIAGSNIPPSIAILDPVSGESFRAPRNVSIQIGAADSDENLSRVELLHNDQSIQTWLEPPYLVQLTNPPLGIHRLQAVAVDAAGATNASQEISFAVEPGARIESFDFNSKSEFRMGVRGGRASTAVLEVSGDMATWVPWSTNILIDGWHEFTDSTAPIGEQRFYRVRITAP